MVGGDSSDEEDADRLREAADNEFLNDSMYRCNTHKGTEPKVPAAVVKCRSLRPDRRQDDPSLLGVTSDFQNHVSKHLMKLIDSQIEEVTITAGGLASTKTSTEDGGVRLLTSSKMLLSVEEEPSEKQTRPRPLKRNLQDDAKSEKERLSEAAVSAEWILSQEAIKGWVKSKKGEVIIVKNSEIVNKEFKGVTWTETDGNKAKNTGEEAKKIKKNKMKILELEVVKNVQL